MEFLASKNAKLIPFVRDSKVVIFWFSFLFVEKFDFVDKGNWFTVMSMELGVFFSLDF